MTTLITAKETIILGDRLLWVGICSVETLCKIPRSNTRRHNLPFKRLQPVTVTFKGSLFYEGNTLLKTLWPSVSTFYPTSSVNTSLNGYSKLHCLTQGSTMQPIQSAFATEFFPFATNISGEFRSRKFALSLPSFFRNKRVSSCHFAATFDKIIKFCFSP